MLFSIKLLLLMTVVYVEVITVPVQMIAAYLMVITVVVPMNVVCPMVIIAVVPIVWEHLMVMLK